MSAPPCNCSEAGVKQVETIKFDQAHPEGQSKHDVVISEGPLNIQVDGTTYTLLRTQGNDRELVAGFLFTEGLIESVDDIMILTECQDAPDVINVTTSTTKEKPRRNLIMTSSCGLCGREDIRGLLQSLEQVESTLQITPTLLYGVSEKIREQQPLFCSTGSAHASALIDSSGSIRCVREDVGRHNALDKIIGHSLMHGLPMNDMVVFLSGRISFELIIKAARARIPVLAAVGAPTGAAVDAAAQLGITLCGFLRDNSVSVYTHCGRIIAV